MSSKHAYLLMLHHRKDLADLLLEAIDDERNDIFVHIDKKCKEFSFSDLKVKRSNIYEVKDRIDVNWGGYSQIRCELALMKEAVKYGPYAYYHLLQDASYPLKSQDELHRFFDERQGTEFVAIDSRLNYHRVQCIHVPHDLKLPNQLHRKLEYLLVSFQRKLGVDRFRQFDMEYKKGFALWSITDGLLKHVLDNEKLIEKMMKYSECGDEVFMQIIAYNSRFKDNLNYIDDNKEFSSSMWASTWPLEDKDIFRERHNFNLEDFYMLVRSDANFARKFEGENGPLLIKMLKQNNERIKGENV